MGEDMGTRVSLLEERVEANTRKVSEFEEWLRGNGGHDGLLTKVRSIEVKLNKLTVLIVIALGILAPTSLEHWPHILKQILKAFLSGVM